MKKIVFFLLGIGIIFGVLWLLLGTNASNSYITSQSLLKPTPTQTYLKEYKSEKYSFAFSYPSDWVYHEFSDGDGVELRPNDARNETITAFITFQVLPKPLSIASLPFEQYVKVAAVNEIQNYKSLASIQSTSTQNGLIGYITTWNVTPLGNHTDNVEETVSLPITYFPARDSKKSIELFLENKQYVREYNMIINSFRYQ